jgi:dihydrofolate synthase/folylpolyglutamate synthase
MYGLQRFGIKPGLDVIRALMQALGNPQERIKTVHVTGTNGKGSTCAFLESMLREAGHTVGLYTSPHLVRFNERICVNGKEISDAELERLAATVKTAAEKAGIQPTFFEFTTAIAFLHFIEKKVDIGVIEVGMGGRLDATNILNPLVTIITNIGFDHMEHLGDTLEKIAFEKAGIIKPGCVVVTAEKDKKLQAYFKSVCDERKATLVIVSEVIDAMDVTSTLAGQQFTVEGIMNGPMAITLLGSHQITNALTALVAGKQLQAKGITITDDDIRKGLRKAKWAGRIDIVHRKPLVIMDGAHNLPGMQMLYAFAKKLPRRKVLVLAMKNDKDVEGMMRLIIPLFDNVIVTQGNFKPTPATELAESAKTFGKPVTAIPDVAEALDAAFRMAGQEDTILVTGSLYMVGDAMKVLRISVVKG